ncbi:VVA0879 family protein [Yersinia massiliensis]|uniref:VVA0879 family protein n=1 Tax=Yersinia massiliensis TaxID=419257 RepID=UPI001CFE8846|nr:VVA0879 family protein [Yersinia massiliensis]MCB5309238.1 hypothetical protein [Yersinia massiliensis]
MKILTLEEFRTEIKAQGVTREDYAFKCPMCSTIQSARDFIRANVGTDFDSIQKHLGFNCIGRFTGKGSPTVEKGKNHGCNWTLGGLLDLNKLEVLTPDGIKHPHFEPATPAEAQAHSGQDGVK